MSTDPTCVARAVAACLFVEWAFVQFALAALVIPPAWRGHLSRALALLLHDKHRRDLEEEEEAAAASSKCHAGKVVCAYATNLAWAGAWALVMPFWLYAGERLTFVLGLVPYMVEWGNFLTRDLTNLSASLAARVQPVVASVSLACTATVVSRDHNVSSWELTVSLLVPLPLLGASIGLGLARCLDLAPDDDRTDSQPRDEPRSSELPENTSEVTRWTVQTVVYDDLFRPTHRDSSPDPPDPGDDQAKH
mmetsp:Transcript_13556/g.42783  ORF Transcript_13556/g.42783 Transcript_13556/m.42783 type:complete len:249 (-) Transcript_13556:300-1046(-)